VFIFQIEDEKSTEKIRTNKPQKKRRAKKNEMKRRNR